MIAPDGSSVGQSRRCGDVLGSLGHEGAVVESRRGHAGNRTAQRCGVGESAVSPPANHLAARPSPVQVAARVEDNAPVTPDGRVLTLAIEAAFPPSLPGQFVHLRLGAGLVPFLRRPFSILGQARGAGGVTRLRIMYAVVGEGTRRLAGCGAGEVLDLVGPLGNGFAPGGHASWILAAGGRGAAPLFRLLEWSRAGGVSQLAAGASPPAAAVRPPAAGIRFLFGARSRAHLWGLERLAGVEHALATDDGSHGRRGTVLDLLAATLTPGPPDAVILACGPEPLLAGVARAARAAGVPAQVSLEAVMGCGCGLCRGCVVPRRPSAAGRWPRDGNARYATACKEGPVFLGGEVEWDAMPGV